MPIKVTTKSFIKKANIKHSDYYTYDNTLYVKSRDKLFITCPIHGDFKQRANNHLNGDGCPGCTVSKISSKVKKDTEFFIEKAKDKHGDTYVYVKSDYIGVKDVLTITCKIHGDFQQIPSNHLSGAGCPRCGKESHWRRSEFIKKAKGRLCTFYTLRCFNETEEFYKIGITMRSIKERYGGTKSMPYAYEIISEIYGEAGFIWDLEKQEKRKLKEFNYQPKLKFGGSKTECFTQYRV